MKSIRSILSVSLLGLAAVLAGGAADATSGDASTEAALSADPNVAATAASAPADSSIDRDGQRGHGRHHHGRPELLVQAALREDLGLTPAQKSTLEALVGSREPASAKGDRKMAGRHPAFDATRAKALADSVRTGNVTAMAHPEPSAEDRAAHVARRAEHAAKAAKKLETLHATLTPEQRTKLVAALEAKRGTQGRREGDKHAEGARGGRHGKGGPLGAMLADLELTATQQAAWKSAMEKNRPERPATDAKRGFEAMRAERKAKLESFASESFDATAFVTPKAKRAPELRNAHVNPMATLVKILEPAQREKLAQRIEQGPRKGEHGWRNRAAN